jgi:DMATS type aromatic prenyltransferase
MLRAINLGLDSHGVLFDAILRVDRKSQVSKPLNLLDKFVCEVPKKHKCAAHMIAFDCIGPRSARIKVYTRSYQVNINNICDMFTLGGKPAMLKGLEILKDILPHLLALEEHRAKDSILTPSNRLHPQDGFVAAYEFTPDHPVPEVKVYILVWCYAVTDKAVGGGLAGWLQHIGWDAEAMSTHRI